jgi:hypothetical protein
MNVKILAPLFATTGLLMAWSREQAAAPPGAQLSAQKPMAVTALLAASINLPTKLCGVLKKVTPEVRNMSPAGARAQLVMAIAGEFDVNAAALQEVSEKIDVIASVSCSAERDILLSVVKMKLLQEAVR